MNASSALLLGQLATALARLEQQLRAQAKAAQDVTMLAVEAEQIAFQARNLVNLPGRDPTDAVAAAYQNLPRFLEQVSVLTEAARQVATINEVMSDKLAGHCERLTEIAGGGIGTDAKTALRSELASLTTTIESVEVGQQASDKLGREIAGLAEAAGELSVC